MNPPAPDPAPPPGAAPITPDDAVTGLPGLRTWRAVYLFVLGCFMLWVGLLTLLTRWFS